MMKTLKLCFLLIIVLFNYSFAQESIDSLKIESRYMDERGFYIKIGDTIPNITFVLDDETTITLNDLKGKVVLLQFTASWCGVCREEMPHIEKDLWQKYKDQGLYVLGVDYDEPLSKVKKFKKQTKITYPLALDPEAKIFTEFAGKYSGVTRNVVLDQNGKVVYLSRLFKIEEFNVMVEAIEKQLDVN
jgi:peroxiredoxin